MDDRYIACDVVTLFPYVTNSFEQKPVQIDFLIIIVSRSDKSINSLTTQIIIRLALFLYKNFGKKVSLRNYQTTIFRKNKTTCCCRESFIYALSNVKHNMMECAKNPLSYAKVHDIIHQHQTSYYNKNCLHGNA